MNKYTYTFLDGVIGELVHLAPNSVGPDVGPDLAILILPGMGMRYTYYIKFAKALADQGYEVFLTDYRGVGTSSIRASRQVDFHFDQYVHDGLFVMETISTYRESSHLILLGHSMGGQLGCLLAGRSTDIQGVILIASCLIYYKGFPYPERFTFRLAAYTFSALAKVLGYFPGDRLGFGGKVTRGIIQDWARNILTGEYESSSATSYDQDLLDLTLPIFILSFEGDRYSAVAAIQNMIHKLGRNSSITNRRIRTDHAGMDHDHYSWARHPKGVIPYVVEWVNQTQSLLPK